MERRVVITGIGAVTPVGNNVDKMWSNIKNGISGIDEITRFDTSNNKVKLAAEVKDLDMEAYFSKKEIKKTDRFTQFALIAADEAINDSKILDSSIDRDRLGVIFSSGIGGLETTEREYSKLLEKGPDRISPFYIPMTIINLAAGSIAIKYGAKAVCTSVVTACASGTNSVGEAFRTIKFGYADAIIAGGAEASITPFGIGGFTVMKALSTAEDKNRASIPFDKERSGFLMGEGAGSLILEEYEHAKKRGAKIYGEVIGYGTNCDAYHITSPSPDGDGAAKCMALAVKEANINLEDVDYINAHGTSTPLNDKFETAAIKRCFGDLADKIPVSSTKSMTGHLLGAAGAVEAIILAKSLQEGFIPPTVNYQVKDEDCDLDVVPNVGRKQDIKYALSNSLGFGGHNATILFKKYEE